jgi:hypothetical protein
VVNDHSWEHTKPRTLGGANVRGSQRTAQQHPTAHTPRWDPVTQEFGAGLPSPHPDLLHSMVLPFMFRDAVRGLQLDPADGMACTSCRDHYKGTRSVYVHLGKVLQCCIIQYIEGAVIS